MCYLSGIVGCVHCWGTPWSFLCVCGDEPPVTVGNPMQSARHPVTGTLPLNHGSLFHTPLLRHPLVASSLSNTPCAPTVQITNLGVLQRDGVHFVVPCSRVSLSTAKVLALFCYLKKKNNHRVRAHLHGSHDIGDEPCEKVNCISWFPLYDNPFSVVRHPHVCPSLTLGVPCVQADASHALRADGGV